MTGNSCHKKNKVFPFLPAFTLAEILVSVSIFSVIMLATTTLFKLAIDGQRSAIASQNVQESVKYFMEVISKEIRMAQRDNGVCVSVPDNSIYAVSLVSGYHSLSFKNYYNQCVRYTLDPNSGRLFVTRSGGSNAVSGYISPARIEVSDLNFVLRDDGITTQPFVTVSLKARSRLGDTGEGSAVYIQTSVSSRYYKAN